MRPERRDFLKKSICAVAGGASMFPVLGQLKLTQAAVTPRTAYSFGDYRALVCVFLYGGNDSFNTVVPRDSGRYKEYRIMRTALALPQSRLVPLDPLADGLPGDGGSYGLHPSMPELAALFNAGHAAIIANVGTLVRPVTKQEIQDGGAPLPPQLYSHSDQQSIWQSSPPDNNATIGWGGRIGDLLHSGNPQARVPMNISLSVQDVFLRGQSVDPYVMDAGGVTPLQYLAMEGNPDGIAAFNALRNERKLAHPFERTFARTLDHAVRTQEVIGDALKGVPRFDGFPDTDLGKQFNTVARLVAARNTLNMRRQVFFVSADGFDTHDGQLKEHVRILGDLSKSLAAFYSALTQIGVQDLVATFTASDFGRTLSINGDGTDHGWGGHHFVVGGAVRGQRIYGQMPSLLASDDNPDDAGYGQIIPSTAVDQYAATLARWLGVGETDLDTIFPNLRHFESRDLGFLSRASVGA